MAKIKVTKVRSAINRRKDQNLTLEALGLKRIGQSNTLDLSKSVQGMVNKVNHLVTVEEI
ncbi:MAG: 50S ribosomal protein L30 [Psychroflexus halocasei]